MSIYGLTAVFASAGIIIILMGAGLELGKILTVIHLHRQWNSLRLLMKAFYITVIMALVILTSLELLGYLTQHHIKGSVEQKSNKTMLSGLIQEENILKEQIEILNNTLSGLPDSYVSKRIREREAAGYNRVQVRLIEIARQKTELEKLNIKDEAFTAPIFAVARIFNLDEIKVAAWFIFLLVLVLEPLSIGLAVAVSTIWLKPLVKTKGIQTDITKALLCLENNFSGTASELLAKLNVNGQILGKHGLAESPQGLGWRLKKNSEDLLAKGFHINQESGKITINFKKGEITNGQNGNHGRKFFRKK